jgi:predicted DsbA family dithiol-disulfide isomerase
MKKIEGNSTHDSKLAIKVWIDFVCPYCLLGKKSLEGAGGRYRNDAFRAA